MSSNEAKSKFQLHLLNPALAGGGGVISHACSVLEGADTTRILANSITPPTSSSASLDFAHGSKE